MNPMLGRFRISWDYLDPQKSDKILSIGCGEGELEVRLVGHIESIDVEDKNYEAIERLWQTTSGIDAWVGDVTEGILYPADYFDKVLFLEVLEHLPKDMELDVLKEIYRVLKPGGRLILSTPNYTCLTKLCDPAWWLRGHRHYQMGMVHYQLLRTGFKIMSSYTGGGFIELVWVPVFYILLRLKLAKYIKPFMDRIIDREYRKPGFYTNIIVGEK